MKIKSADLSDRIDHSGEAVLGPDESGALTTYLMYGVLAPYETGRRLRPGEGREEILFVIDGELRLEGETAEEETQCSQGMALMLPEGSDFWLSNTTGASASYVLAGGFTKPAHFYRWMQEQQAGTTRRR